MSDNTIARFLWPIGPISSSKGISMQVWVADLHEQVVLQNTKLSGFNADNQEYERREIKYA